MTIREAIEMADRLEHNSVDYGLKVGWLSDLDSKIYTEIMLTHEGLPEDSEPPHYGPETDVETELLVTDPHAAAVYSNHLRAMINEAANDTGRYNASVAQFNTALQTYSNWYNKQHMPIYTGTWRF